MTHGSKYRTALRLPCSHPLPQVPAATVRFDDGLVEAFAAAHPWGEQPRQPEVASAGWRADQQVATSGRGSLCQDTHTVYGAFGTKARSEKWPAGGDDFLVNAKPTFLMPATSVVVRKEQACLVF